LVGCGRGCRDFLDFENFRAAVAGDEGGFQKQFLVSSCWFPVKSKADSSAPLRLAIALDAPTSVATRQPSFALVYNN
jgi:hypothetical protein